MWSITDWFLDKMNLMEEDEGGEDILEEDVIFRLEKVSNERIFCKNVKSYDDAREVLSEYKSGAECVILFGPGENSDPQGMMNYICGGVFVLEGNVRDGGGNVFIVSHKGKKAD